MALYPGTSTFPGPSTYPGAGIELDLAGEIETTPEVTPLGIVAIPLLSGTLIYPGASTYPSGTTYPDEPGTVETETALDITPVGIIALDVAVELEHSPHPRYEHVLDIAIEREIAFEIREPRRVSAAPGIVRIGNPRVIAQRILDGAFLDWELPVADLSITKTLSGPQAITGKLRPALPRVVELGLRPWNTWLHVEDDAGILRGSAILVAPFGVTDDTRSVETAGVATIPHQAFFEGVYSGTNLDPLDVVRMLWAHAGSFPDIGPAVTNVSVSAATSGVRIGGAQDETVSARTTVSSGTGASADSSESSDPDSAVYALNWWDHKNVGDEIDTLARNVPFDYLEREAWADSTRRRVLHTIDLGWPRSGRRRDDLRFAQGENIIGAVPVAERDDAYVTDVRVTGAGEGSAMILGTASRRAGQLRRVVTIDEKTVKSTGRANAIAKNELLRRTSPRGVDTILVEAFHRNAPYGSYSEGDDIRVQVDVDHVGPIDMWHRVLTHTWTPDQDAVAIKLAPSDSFRYGTAA